MEAILFEDRKAIESRLPIPNRHCPLFGDVPHRQINQLESSLIIGENLLRLNHLPQATIHRLNSIGSINRPANLRGEGKEGDNIRPVTAPRLGDRWVLLVPLFGKEFEVKLCLRFRCRSINRLEVSTNLLTLLLRHKSNRVSDHVDNA